MDVDSLRNELEEHLKRNPDEHAPSGFRDRFAATLEDIEGAQDDESKKELEAELQRIRAEAEAAANCADCADDSAAEAGEAGSHEHDAGAAAPAAEAPVADAPAAEAPVAETKVEEPAATAPPAEAANDPVAAPESGLMQRYGLILAAILVALVVAIYFYR